MSEPRLTPLSPLAQSLLAEERATPSFAPPSASDIEGVLAGLESTVFAANAAAAPAAPGASASSASASSAGASSAAGTLAAKLGALKLGGALILGAMAGSGATWTAMTVRGPSTLKAPAGAVIPKSAAVAPEMAGSAPETPASPPPPPALGSQDPRTDAHPPPALGSQGPRTGALPPPALGAQGPRTGALPSPAPGSQGPRAGALPPPALGSQDPRAGALPSPALGAQGPRTGALPPPALGVPAGESAPPNRGPRAVAPRPAPAMEQTPATSGSLAPEQTATSGSLAREQALLETARMALARARPTEALEALAAHEREFRDGTLVEEREALRVQAISLQGDPEAATRAASAFERRFPTSVLLPAVWTAAESTKAR